MSRARLAVLISGTGRNLQAILDASRDGRLAADVVGVISNRPGVAGLDRARRAGVPAQVIDHRDFADREAFDRTLAQALEALAPDVIALAGFMRILTPGFIRRFSGRLVNIHPSLLPKYRGLHTHQRALDAGDAWHGASIHFVTEELDAGAVIKQGRLAIAAGESAQSLAQRVMERVELQLYPEVLDWLARGHVILEDGCAVMDGRRLTGPLIEDYE